MSVKYSPSDVAMMGINFGNSYASIAIINKEGQPDCIANEDGERQIACAISYHGQEVYIGNQAKPQLIKNSANTITGFRDLLGKSYSAAKPNNPIISAPIVHHNDLPAYTVTIPAPIPQSIAPTPTPSTRTPSASYNPTPLQSPPNELAEICKTLTVPEVTTIFLQSLRQSAQDFLGKPIRGAVITVPSSFTPPARQALKQAAEAAGLPVLQLIDEASAAALAYSSLPPSAGNAPSPDRTTLVLDLGASSLNLTLLSIKHGLFHTISSSTTLGVGGNAIDDRLITYFAKEFTKKTKIPLSLTGDSPADKRALAKLRLAVEHTKRTLSASPGAATCSVESLKDGMDFSGSINRLRFDLEVRNAYTGVWDAIKTLLASVDKEPVHVNEVILVGGTSSLPGLINKLEEEFGEETEIRTEIAADQVIGRGAALQAQLLATLAPGDPLAAAFQDGTSHITAKATSKPLGLYFPEEGAQDGLGQWISVIAADTPLPCRRTVKFEVESRGRVGFEVWEVKEIVKVETLQPGGKSTVIDEEEDDEDEDEEPVELRELSVEKETYLASVEIPIKAKGSARATMRVQLFVNAKGALQVKAWEGGEEPIVVNIK